MSRDALTLGDVAKMRADARARSATAGALDALTERITTGRKKISAAKANGADKRKVLDAELKLAELGDEWTEMLEGAIKAYLLNALWHIGVMFSEDLYPGPGVAEGWTISVNLPGVIEETLALGLEEDVVPF